MATWSDLAAGDPELAGAGYARLVGPDGIAIGFLATVTADGAPRMAPVCPIWSGGEWYVSVGAHTPKVRDLRRNGRYALHAFLGHNDEEFQMWGRAVEVVDEGQRGVVHSAIRFGAFGRNDPVFRLAVDRASWVRWENVGQPGTIRRPRRWP